MPVQIFKSVVAAALWLSALTAAAYGQSATPTPVVKPELKMNEPLERELKRGEFHSYFVTLAAGEFAQVRVEQKGVDVVLGIHSADGRRQARMDSPNGRSGFETLSFVAPVGGTYVVRVERLAQEGNPESGRYRIELTAKHAATAADFKRVEAERQLVAVMDGDPATAAQLSTEIERAELLAGAWRELNDPYVSNLIQTRIDNLKRFKATLEAEERKRGLVRERVERERAHPSAPRLTVPVGHASNVKFAALSPDGNLLASSSSDETIKLWDVATGRDLKTLRGHVGSVAEIAFSPDGKSLVSASDDRTLKLWDMATGQELKTFNGHRGCVTSVAFSPDGKSLASGGCDDVVKLWDVSSGRELATLSGHTDIVWSVAFSPDGRTVAAGSYDRTIRLWDVATRRALRTITGKINAVWSVAFSPDGKTLATGSYSDAVKLWDVATGQEVRTYTQNNPDGSPKKFPPNGKMMSVVFSPDGSMLAASLLDRTLRLWDVKSGQELKTFSNDGAFVESLVFSPDGRQLIAGGNDQTVKLWDVATGRQSATFRGHTSGLSPHQLSPDGRTLCLLISDKALQLWDLAAGGAPRTLKAPPYSGLFESAAEFSPDGKLLVSKHADKTLKLWEVATGRERATLKGHAGMIKTMLFSRDSKTLISGDAEGMLKLWDAATGRELQTFRGHTGSIASVAFSPDGRTLASGSSDMERRLDHTYDRFIAAMNKGEPKSGAPLQTLAPIQYDETVRLWDMTTGREIKTLGSHSTGVYTVAFSPDGKTLVSGDSEVKFWDVATGAERKYDEPPAWARRKEPDDRIPLPNGRAVRPSAEGNTVVLRDAVDEKEVATFVALEEDDWAVVDPDGRWDASDGARKLMYYTLTTPEGFEVIEFSQLKERYYEPNLLPRLLGYNKEPLRDVAGFKDVLLPPAVIPVEPADPASTARQVRLRNRNGGIGRVQVFVDGREYLEDARDDALKANPNLREYVLSFDLGGVAVEPGRSPEVKVVAWNYDEKAKEQYKGYISSRGVRLVYQPAGLKAEEKAGPPTLYAIIGGVSDYKSGALKLQFAARDAEAIYRAIEVGGKNLFGVERVRLKLLSTGGSPDAVAPTKENFHRAFEEFSRAARPGDILFVYLAGHGITLNPGNDTYYYLTQQATTTDKETLGKDSELLASTTINSEELTAWHKSVKARKQVLILDTCAAGALGAGFNLSEPRDLSSDAKRALERMKTRVGFHVLMGSAADAFSYEASQYGQGLLTYALLQGMKGAALEPDGQIDVSRLFNYAADAVPHLARNIGGIQRPEIKVPEGGLSFAFGLIKTVEDKRRIPLASAKPVLLRPSFQNQQKINDDLKIAALLRDRLREVSYATRGDAELVFMDTDEMPDAIIPVGRYVVEGDAVTVTVKLLRNDELLATVKVKGRKSDLSELTEKILRACLAQLNRVSPLTRNGG